MADLPLILPTEILLSDDQVRDARRGGYLDNYHCIKVQSGKPCQETWVRFKVPLPNDSQIISGNFSDWTRLFQIKYLGFCLAMYGDSIRENEQFSAFLDHGIVGILSDLTTKIQAYIRKIGGENPVDEITATNLVNEVCDDMHDLAKLVLKIAPDVIVEEDREQVSDDKIEK